MGNPRKEKLLKIIQEARTLVEITERKREYQRMWYKKNAEVHKARTKANRKRRHKEWMTWKATLSCTECGFSHPAAIDFHHIKKDPSNRAVNQLVKDGRYSAATEEIEKKCIPLCSNCHRILHWKEIK